MVFYRFKSDYVVSRDNRVLCPLQLRGECLEQYVAAAQDTTKNAQARSLQAAYGCWVEQLRSDQVSFNAQLIMLHG